MEVEVNEDKEKFTDFFWLVQKSIKIYENDEDCLGSGRRENCYFARRRKRIAGTVNNIRTAISYHLFPALQNWSKLVCAQQYALYNRFLLRPARKEWNVPKLNTVHAPL